MKVGVPMRPPGSATYVHESENAVLIAFIPCWYPLIVTSEVQLYGNLHSPK